MRSTLITLSASAVLAAATSAALISPASAEGIGVKDPRDTSHGSDLRSVQVKHGRENVKIITTHENLRRDPASGSGGVIYLDTDPEDEGPEFALVGGYFVGTDYQLVETEGFGTKSWKQPVEFGDYRQTVNYTKEHVRTRSHGRRSATPTRSGSRSVRPGRGPPRSTGSGSPAASRSGWSGAEHG